MRERKEVYDAVFLAKRHTSVVGIHGRTVLAVGKDDAFTVTSRSAGIENVADIVIVADSEDVPSLRELVCGPVEDAKTAVTESPLFSRMFR